MNYLEPFLNSQLYGDCNEGQRFMDSINTSSSLRVGLKKSGDIVCNVIGVKEYENTHHFSIFPNPATNQLTITFHQKRNTPISFELYDISGRLVLSTIENSNASKKEINIENMDKGSYILYVRQNEVTNAYKIIKQ
ncbi:MAG: T9SS type A sorting domain-containing protein [Bacteroidetes bacterium]|nr:T9SS type A sorting domain-containing protein [Bacteroidota bacterium]